MPNRFRTIVRLASNKTEDASLRRWFRWDEKGFWERQAKDLVEKTASQATAKGMTEAQVDEEIATYLAYLGATALLNDAKKRSNT